MNQAMVDLKWNRPEIFENPRTWLTFEAKDINSDKLVEYYIQDLPESRFAEAIQFMASNFCKDEPLSQAFGELKFSTFQFILHIYDNIFSGTINDADAVEDYKVMVEILLRQKVALVCFRSGSDEIVGINVNFVMLKGEHFWEEIGRIVSILFSNSIFGKV